MHDSPAYRSLAAYRRCAERVTSQWARFAEMRADRLRHGEETERVAEAILEDLFTEVLDWSKGDIAYQIDYADIVLSKNLEKYLVLEVKRPGALAPGRQKMLDAMAQARRYADQQRVSRIAASDGRFLYAVDIEQGAPRDRVLVDLSSLEAPHSLWWLSVHGIYRVCEEAVQWPTVPVLTRGVADETAGDAPLHPKYKLPSICFAYVGDANDPHAWRLPYRKADRTIDTKRLPKAIQALLSNYRGAKVTGIPEAAIAAVLLTLARAAAAEGKMPPAASNAATIYGQLAHVLEQQGLTLEAEVGERG